VSHRQRCRGETGEEECHDKHLSFSICIFTGSARDTLKKQLKLRLNSSISVAETNLNLAKAGEFLPSVPFLPFYFSWFTIYMLASTIK
jgi:hypothetical protein